MITSLTENSINQNEYYGYYLIFFQMKNEWDLTVDFLFQEEEDASLLSMNIYRSGLYMFIIVFKSGKEEVEKKLKLVFPDIPTH